MVPAFPAETRRHEHHLVRRRNPRTRPAVAHDVGAADRKTPAAAARRDHRQAQPAAPRWRAAARRLRQTFRGEPDADTAAIGRKATGEYSPVEKRTGKHGR